jgi:hypothetical protein
MNQEKKKQDSVLKSRITHFKKGKKLGIVAYPYNPATWEVEIWRIKVQDQLGQKVSDISPQ